MAESILKSAPGVSCCSRCGGSIRPDEYCKPCMGWPGAAKPDEFGFDAMAGLLPGLIIAEGSLKTPGVVEFEQAAERHRKTLSGVTICVIIGPGGSVQVGASLAGIDAARQDAIKRGVVF